MTTLECYRTSASVMAGVRRRARSKFIFVGDEKLWVRGVTYGSFRPRDGGNEYPASELVEQDFAQIAANWMNAVRT